MENFRYYLSRDYYSFYFFKVPKELFTPKYDGLSNDAKLLYSLMVERTMLSLSNQVMDEYERIFIYFSLETACEFLNCGMSKATRLMRELCDEKYSLIKRINQGQGKTCLIYVRNLAQW